MLRVKIDALNFFQKLSCKQKGVHYFLHNFIAWLLFDLNQLIFVNPTFRNTLVKIIEQVIKLNAFVEYAFYFVNVSIKVGFSPCKLDQTLHDPGKFFVSSAESVDLNHAWGESGIDFVIYDVLQKP